ncbi:hypothetical protein GCM10029964_085860 [Kibdelosporangium lantanae]
MKEFTFQRAARVRDALDQVAGTAGAKFLGGGTNLVDLMKNEIETPTRLVDVRGLPFPVSGSPRTADWSWVRPRATATPPPIPMCGGGIRR